MAQSSHTLGIDTGGTFTDVVLIDAQGRVVSTHKLPSTPDDPSKAVLAGIDAALQKHGLQPRESHTPHDSLPGITHGSTVATNALLEGDAGNAALLTTAGFEDVLRLARQNRPQLYALVPRRPDPPIPPQRCFGIAERMAFDGSVITPLDDATLPPLFDQLEAQGVESVAVCLLHSYTNPAHEQSVAAALRRRFGEALHVTVSSELLPEFREYERTATCAVNAVVAPRMARYLGKLEAAIGGERLSIMASHGGTLSVRAARREPVRTVLSGPAGGVRGAAAFADRLITLDMGGTSTDVSLIHDQPTMTSHGEAGGLPVRLPMIDIHTIGAGGGSIAWLDPGGALRVGPRSAGASPGPACYGQQRALIERGELDAWRATVTDANVVLGRIPADATLGDDTTLDADAAHEAVAALAQRAGLSADDAAAGILRVVEANMARAIGRVTLQVGRDPRDYALMPFGGAGALHACALAEALGIATVHVPPNPGLLSAIGMLAAPGRRTAARSLHRRVPPEDAAPDLSGLFAELAADADRQLRDDGLSPASHRFTLDLRYAGQSHELTLDATALDAWRDEDYRQRFHAEHERLYGHAARDAPIELVVARVEADSPTRTLTTEPPTSVAATDDEGARVLPRTALRPGDALGGPRIITEYSATTYLAQGWALRVLDDGSLMLKRENAAEKERDDG